jgi:hypothetical protein
MKTAVRLFLDVEFNGTHGELISAALVSAQGDRWYEVLDTTNIDLVPWVQENVMPVIAKDPISIEAFEASLDEFLAQFGFVEFIYNAHADKRYLDAILDGLPRVPLHKCTRDGKLSAASSAIPHNALHDALAIVAQVAGSPMPNAYGCTERELFLNLWDQGYPFDRRDVNLIWRATELPECPGATVTLHPTPGHKTLHGETKFSFYDGNKLALMLKGPVGMRG